MTQITYTRNVISIEHTASALFCYFLASFTVETNEEFYTA